ncbi:MAG: galactosyltransferase-related protein, partial [Blastocatellia bacterium]
AQGGGSIAIDKEVYFAIGGFDESFVGWGGEDMEFWDRAATRSVWPYGYMPLVHLWHEPQPGKRAIKGNGAHTAWLTEKRAAIPPQLRIEELKGREIGSLHYPSSVGR